MSAAAMRRATMRRALRAHPRAAEVLRGRPVGGLTMPELRECMARLAELRRLDVQIYLTPTGPMARFELPWSEARELLQRWAA
jgi:hypothetical protein